MNLNDIAYYVTDKVPSTQITLEQYITTDNLLPQKGGRVCAISLPPNKCSLTHYQKGDVLVANIRPYLQKIWYADIEGGASPDVLVFRAKEGHNSQYVYACLLQDAFFNFVMKAPIGAKMPRGERNHILRFPIVPIDNEEIVGKMISNIDRKIALNRAMNEELEAMARQLYDYWFLQFDFPDANGKPYRSSGGKMVYNDILKREIPEGWEVGNLEQIANITMGQSPIGSSYNEIGKGTIFYQGSTDFGARFPSIRMFTTEPSRFAKKGDILMSVRAPVGTLNVANTDCCIGRGLAALNSKLESMTHLFYVLSDLKAAFDARNVAGTTFGSITKNDLHNLLVLIPQKDIVANFETICSPMYNEQMKLEEATNSLRSLRDELLPLLMNGQVTIKE